MSRKSATAYLSSHGQTEDSVNLLVKQILGRAGCERCGLIAFMHIDFISDPGPDLLKRGVTSLALEGMAAK